MEIEEEFKQILENRWNKPYYKNGVLCINKKDKITTFTVHEFEREQLQCIVNKAEFIVLRHENNFYVCSNTELKEWAKREKSGFHYKEISGEMKRLINQMTILWMSFIFKKI